MSVPSSPLEVYVMRNMHRHLAYFVLLSSAIFLSAHVAAQQTWEMNLRGADIRELISKVSEISGRNFVLDPRVRGEVTVISPQPLDAEGVYQIFLSVLRVHGYAAVESETGIKIIPQATARQTIPLASSSTLSEESLVTEVVPVVNSQAASLVDTLRPLVAQHGHVAAVERANVIIISDHVSNIARLKRLIREIDVADEQEMLVVSLEHMFVGNLVEVLQRLAPETLGQSGTGPQRVQLVGNTFNNSLILRGKSSALAPVLKLIGELDQPARQSGAPEVHFLQHSDASVVAKILRELAPTPTGEDVVSEVSIGTDETTNSVVIRADPRVRGEFRQVIRQLDVRRPQVLIEAAIIEVSLTDTLRAGVEFAVADGDGRSAPLATTALDATLAPLFASVLAQENQSSIDPIAAVGNIYQAGGGASLAVARLDAQGISFAAMLRLLATSTAVNLLSTPSVMALNNEQTILTVGQNIPINTGSFTTSGDGSNNPFRTTDRKDVGITLDVTPHINEGNQLRLKVVQTVETIEADASARIGDILTNKREINATILADDGQTIVLGGLIQDDVETIQRKVPVLGSIPIAGRLFRSDSDTHRKRNLIVLLRPTIMRDAESVAQATKRKYEGVFETELTGRELEDIYDGRDSETVVEKQRR